ncbi:MAG: hypothetical protein GEU28_06255 [Dehalococcoidia bacterium]|nr:hypothetical protein [Dehalococcoidia bacterium]
MDRYTMVVSRDDNDTWFAELAEERRCHTWGRTLAATRDRMREAVAVWYEVAPDSFDLREDIRLPDDLRRRLDITLSARDSARREMDAAQAETARTVRALVDAGLSRRDVAYLVGLSHQRVQQILDSPAPPAFSYELPPAPRLTMVAETAAEAYRPESGRP